MKRKDLVCFLAAMCLGCSLMAVSVAAQFSVPFAARRDFPGGGRQSGAIAGGDYNQDGRVDLAIANLRDHSVAVLFGVGDGTFQPFATFSAGFQPSAVEAGDLNMDGKLDLVTATFAPSGSVNVLLGNGDGTFQSPIFFASGVFPRAVAISDLNADGKPDVVAVNTGSSPLFNVNNNVSVLLGNGNGTLQDAMQFGVGPQPFDVTVSDFNNDAKPDLAVCFTGIAAPAGGITMLLGAGNGTFQPAPTLTNVIAPLASIAHDFDNNGTMDLAVTNTNGNSRNVSVLSGNGNGTFKLIASHPVGQLALSLTRGDVNGDGMIDLAVANKDSQTISVLLGNGNGSFQTPTNYYAGRDPVAIIAFDFDGDGRSDLATANQASDSISVFLGKSAGLLTPEQSFNAGGMSPNFIIAADFNSDCKMDVATANSNSNNVSVLLGNGNGTFQTSLTYSAGTQPFHLAAGDFNNDGKLDLAVANAGVPASDPGGVSILIGNGDGTFQTALNFTAGDAPVYVAVGDFNLDGKQDIAVPNFRSNTVSIFLGNGNGTFQAAPTLVFPALSGLTSIAAGDFNRDGKTDLEVVSTFASTILMLIGNGNGTFTRGTDIIYPVERNIGAFIVTDLNNDDKQDLISSVGIVLLGNGNATFQAVPDFVSSSNSAIAAADMNGDGIVDIALTNLFSMRFSVLAGNGNGSFQPQVRYGSSGLPQSLVAADFNGDAKPDLALADSLPAAGDTDKITLMINKKLLWKKRRVFCHIATPSAGDQ